MQKAFIKHWCATSATYYHDCTWGVRCTGLRGTRAIRTRCSYQMMIDCNSIFKIKVSTWCPLRTNRELWAGEGHWRACAARPPLGAICTNPDCLFSCSSDVIQKLITRFRNECMQLMDINIRSSFDMIERLEKVNKELVKKYQHAEMISKQRFFVWIKFFLKIKVPVVGNHSFSCQ